MYQNYSPCDDLFWTSLLTKRSWISVRNDKFANQLQSLVALHLYLINFEKCTHPILLVLKRLWCSDVNSDGLNSTSFVNMGIHTSICKLNKMLQMSSYISYLNHTFLHSFTHSNDVILWNKLGKCGTKLFFGGKKSTDFCLNKSSISEKKTRH